MMGGASCAGKIGDFESLRPRSGEGLEFRECKNQLAVKSVLRREEGSRRRSRNLGCE